MENVPWWDKMAPSNTKKIWNFVIITKDKWMNNLKKTKNKNKTNQTKTCSKFGNVISINCLILKEKSFTEVHIVSLEC